MIPPKSISTRAISFRRSIVRSTGLNFFRRAALGLAAGLAAFSAEALEILGDPVLRYVGQNQLEVRWQTDQPSDSRVEYGINPPHMTLFNPAPVTDHILVVPNLQPGQPYNFFITSTAGPQVAETGEFFFNAQSPVAIQEPARSVPTDPPPLVSGLVQIIVGASHPSIQIQSVTFLYIPPAGGPAVLIGVDTDGRGVVANTFEPAPTGDGWSAEWNTAGLPEGNYTLIAQFNTSIGQLQTTSQVFLDHQPPDPVVLNPAFGSRTRGSVMLNAQGGQGVQAEFHYQGPTPALLSFAPVGLAQTNFPYDGNRGRMMCDPTSQASILLGIPRFRMALLANASFQKALKKCTNSGTSMEDCIRQILIKVIARQKGTSSTGTNRDGEIAGSNAVLDGLRLPWDFERKKDKRQNNHSYTVAQLKACSAMEGVLGVVVHVAPCNNMNGTGHAMALKSINDVANADGTFTVTFMDPASGMDSSFNVAPGGSFTYGGVAVCIRSMGMFIDRSGNNFLTDSGWESFATDNNGADGWTATWRPTGLVPGFYWLRVMVTDERGRSGEDFTEVYFAPPVLTITRNGGNVVVRWPADAANYDLEFTTSLPAPIWNPVTEPVVIQGGENTVTMGVPGAARFVRLRER